VRMSNVINCFWIILSYQQSGVVRV
jgi:hypothetical protein